MLRFLVIFGELNPADQVTADSARKIVGVLVLLSFFFLTWLSWLSWPTGILVFVTTVAGVLAFSLDIPFSLYYTFAMNYAKKILEALYKAELEVRSFGAEAFKAGEDEAADLAKSVVETLKSLTTELPSSSGSQQKPKPRQTSSQQRKRARNGSKKRAKKKGRSSKYPKFSVRNGFLYRVGWSKKNKSEYQHKVPERVFSRTIASMENLAKKGSGPFMADAIIENAEDADGPVPSYQAYVVIGLLRAHDVIEQIGREGYRINEDLVKQAESLWNSL